MLGTIEADLAGGKLDSMQVEPLRWRAELMRRLLTPRRTLLTILRQSFVPDGVKKAPATVGVAAW